MKDRSCVLYGILTMGAWLVFLVVLFGLYLIAEGYPVTYFVDEETGGLISLAFFVAWAAIWYGIGAHYRRVYLVRKDIMRKMYPEMNEKALPKQVLLTILRMG